MWGPPKVRVPEVNEPNRKLGTGIVQELSNVRNLAILTGDRTPSLSFLVALSRQQAHFALEAPLRTCLFTEGVPRRRTAALFRTTTLPPPAREKAASPPNTRLLVGILVRGARWPGGWGWRLKCSTLDLVLIPSAFLSSRPQPPPRVRIAVYSLVLFTF